MLFVVLSLFSFTSFADLIDNANHPARIIKNQSIEWNIYNLQHLNSGSSNLDLWSGHGWNHSRGILARRYQDPRYEKLKTIQERYRYIKDNPAIDIFYSGNQDRINRLSPSEKYDLLVGDLTLTLTNAMWRRSFKEIGADGKIPSWSGVCEGWSAASIRYQRPQRLVWAKAFDGKTWIPFLPEEIKALATMLWSKAIAKNPNSFSFVGRRCKKANLIGPSCRDINPASFHLALTHIVGAQKYSFISDISPNHEVWNKPVRKYSIKYFSPINNRVSSLNKAFARSKTTGRLVVGVETNITYTHSGLYRAQSSDSSKNDRLLSYKYRYVLELNSHHQIIGGVWLSKKRPDFIWQPLGTPQSPHNDKLTYADWTAAQAPVSEEVNLYAPYASQALWPLTTVIERLIQFSRIPQGG